MISHKYKCIFIHIPRTAGTSIEKWIVKKDWWRVEPKTKHLLASQAKKIYAEYWDEYFKFSFVRNPWDRVISMSKYGSTYGVYLNHNLKQVDLTNYIKKFGYPLTIEHDYRFYEKSYLKNDSQTSNCVYGNILDEDLDFVGKFENLKQDSLFLKSKLNIENEFNIHSEVNKNRPSCYSDYYDNDSRNAIEDLYRRDIENFNYQF